MGKIKNLRQSSIKNKSASNWNERMPYNGPNPHKGIKNTSESNYKGKYETYINIKNSINVLFLFINLFLT